MDSIVNHIHSMGLKSTQPIISKFTGVKIAHTEDINGIYFELIEALLKSHGPLETVTYHNPCHLRNAQKVHDKVENLLKRLPGFRCVPAADADSCCGGGATFF